MTKARVSSAELWAPLNPTDLQICDTAIRIMENENSSGVVVISSSG